MLHTYKSYISGFILSVFFTVLAFVMVQQHLVGGNFLIAILLTLALVQALIQLMFFLHLGQSRWNIAALLSTVAVMVILVAGSLWIMGHLNYHMTPQEMDKDIINMEGIRDKMTNYK